MVEELYWTQHAQEEEDPDIRDRRIFFLGGGQPGVRNPDPDDPIFGDPFEGEETTMPETQMASLRARAAAAARAREREEATTDLIRLIHGAFGIEISAKDITGEDGEFRYITDGLEFGLDSERDLVLYRVCEECGRTVGCAVYSLRSLDDWLKHDALPLHYCGEFEEDRNYRGPAARPAPPRTVTESEAALLDALRAYVRFMPADPE